MQSGDQRELEYSILRTLISDAEIDSGSDPINNKMQKKCGQIERRCGRSSKDSVPRAGNRICRLARGAGEILKKYWSFDSGLRNPRAACALSKIETELKIKFTQTSGRNVNYLYYYISTMNARLGRW